MGLFARGFQYYPPRSHFLYLLYFLWPHRQVRQGDPENELVRGSKEGSPVWCLAFFLFVKKPISPRCLR